MMNADGARAIYLESIEARIASGKEKAMQVLDQIEKLIIRAASLCETRTEIHVLRLTTFIDDNEQRAYICTLREILKDHGYAVSFSPSSNVMQIIWGA
jgi:hypothetical protein